MPGQPPRRPVAASSGTCRSAACRLRTSRRAGSVRALHAARPTTLRRCAQRVQWTSGLVALQFKVPGRAPGLNRRQFTQKFSASECQRCASKLDLRQPAAQGVWQRLLQWAFVTIESCTPGTINQLDIAYARARIETVDHPAQHPRNQPVRPVAPSACYDDHAIAVARCYEAAGPSHRRSDGRLVAHTDTIGPSFAIATLITALGDRHRTDEGHCVDRSQIETAPHFPTRSHWSRRRPERWSAGSAPARAASRCKACNPYRSDEHWGAIAVDTGA